MAREKEILDGHGPIAVFKKAGTDETIRMNGEPVEIGEESIFTLFPERGAARELLEEVLGRLARQMQSSGGQLNLGQLAISCNGFCCPAEKLFVLEKLLQKYPDENNSEA